MAFFNARQAADAGTDEAPDSLGIGLGDLQPGILDRLHRCPDAVVDEGVHFLGFLQIQVAFNLKILHRSTDAHWKIADVESGDRPDPAAASQNMSPGGLHGAAHRGHDAHARYYHPPLDHATALICITLKKTRPRPPAAVAAIDPELSRTNALTPNAT